MGGFQAGAGYYLLTVSKERDDEKALKFTKGLNTHTDNHSILGEFTKMFLC